jgi:hypothetical protein
MIQIHIDNETRCTKHSAQLLSVGAVAKRLGDTAPRLDFYVEIDTTSYGDNPDFTVCSNTELWWANRGGFEPTTDELVPWGQAMWRLYDFFGLVRDHFPREMDDDQFEVWANSPSFDLAQLTYHFERCDLKPVWGFWQERDVRTVRKLAEALHLPITRPPAPHHALGDAAQQLEFVERVYTTLAHKVQRINELNAAGVA